MSDALGTGRTPPRAGPAIVIVADDLSSATDCGVRMASGGRRVVVPLRDDAAIPDGVDVVARDTDSRALDATAAFEAVRACAARHPGSLVYKSIDSTLRGNLGAEIDALLETRGFDLAVVAPAFPAQGRTTIGGVQHLHGVPVHETEFGTDPTAPVTTSSIAGRLAAQSARRAVAVGTDALRPDPAGLRRHAARARCEGAALLILDAEHEDDLERAAAGVAALDERVLWVGSTGWARYVPDATGVPVRDRASAAGIADGPIAIVAGSASAVTRRQLDALAAAREIVEVRIDARALAAGGAGAEDEISRGGERLADAVRRGARVLALTLTASREDVAASVAIGAAASRGPEGVCASLVEGLARLARGLAASATPPRGFVLTGGDTAKAVVGALGADLVHLIDEVEPGVPIGRLRGRHEALVITKAGGFGNPGTLTECVRRIETHGTG